MRPHHNHNRQSNQGRIFCNFIQVNSLFNFILSFFIKESSLESHAKPEPKSAGKKGELTEDNPSDETVSHCGNDDQ